MAVLSELFKMTGSAGDASVARRKRNLIVLPVKSVTEATHLLTSARNQPTVTATALLQQSYDISEATRLLASVCNPERGADVMKACRAGALDGPLLVTTQRPLGRTVARGERMLIVNLSTTSPEAVREVLAAYRRQILREEFDKWDKLEEWRLLALNQMLDVAKLLPGVSKAYAGGK